MGELQPRLCTVRKWADFRGYGFNLHAERGRAGQYIRKVDDGSPAQAAGMKEGDRIVEVNGVNICNQNHSQCVTRIKASGGHVTMLLVDLETDKLFKEQKVVICNDMPEVRRIETPPRPSKDEGSDAADTIRATNDEHTKDIRSGNKAFGNTYDRRQLAWGSDAADTIRATNDEHTKDIRSGNKEFGNTYDRRHLAWGSDAADTIRATNDEHSKDIRSGNKEFGNTYDRRQLAWGSDAADTIRATNDEHSKDIRSGNKEFGNTYDRRQLAWGSDAADTIRATNDEHSKDIRSGNKEFGNTYDHRQLACASDAADTIRATNDEHSKDIRSGNKEFGNTYDRRQLACASDAADTIRATNDEHSKDIRSGNKEFGNTYDRRQLACASDAADTIRATNDKHTHEVKDNRTGNNRYGNTYMYDRRQLACDTADTTVEGTNSYARQHLNNDGLAFDNLNLKFYRNEIVSKPVGRKIENILKLDGDHVAIEENPAFFYWLFPTQQYSLSNRFAQPLQVHEAEAIRDTPELKNRFLRAYKMMLDFYGMELASEETGEVQSNPRTCRERLIYLNRSPSDHPRITRIITSLGILGFKHYQLPWLRFLMRESLREGTLAAIPTEVLQQHWVSALSSDEDQMNAVIYSTTLQDEKK